MIEYKHGNIFDEDVQAIVNTVNCVGVMGRGIALQFKKLFPDNFKAYKKACDNGEVTPGKMFVFEEDSWNNPKFIINFPTKRHWRGKSKLEDVDIGLIALKKIIQEKNITSIAIPPLGSGLGGLNWNDVKKLIGNHLSDLKTVQIFVFEPNQSYNSASNFELKNAPTMSNGRAILVLLMHRYLNGLLDPFVTLLELHKLMYFMQESGENLRLRYTKAKYGPYAENLRHVLNQIEGYYVSGYADGGDLPNKQISLVPGAFQEATRFLEENLTTKSRFEEVSELVEGFESPYGLELLATVHWLKKQDKVLDSNEAIDATYAWNDRKKRFTPRQIEIAYDRLERLGWA